MKIVIVLAGTHREAHMVAAHAGLKRGQWAFPFDVHAVRGLHAPEVWDVAKSAYRHPHYAALLLELAHRNATIVAKELP